MQSGLFVLSVFAGHLMKLRIAQIPCALYTPFDLAKILHVRVLVETQEKQWENLKRDTLKIVIKRLLETVFFDQESTIASFKCNWSSV